MTAVPGASAVVVDASLAAQWVFAEADSAQAIALLTQWEEAGILRLAPHLFLSEINTSALRRLRGGNITITDAVRAVNDILAAMTVVAEDAALSLRALAIADSLAQRNSYDSLYTALAERETCDYWTGDERFYNTAHSRYPWVRWLGEQQT